MSGGCAVHICPSHCRTQSRYQEDTQQEDTEVLLPGPEVFQGTKWLLADVWLSCPEMRALRKLCGEQAAAVATAPCSRTSEGALGLERTLKIHSFLYLVTKITLCSDSSSPSPVHTSTVGWMTEGGFYSWRPHSMCPPNFLRSAQFPGLLATIQSPAVNHLLCVRGHDEMTSVSAVGWRERQRWAPCSGHLRLLHLGSAPFVASPPRRLITTQLCSPAATTCHLF